LHQFLEKGNKNIKNSKFYISFTVLIIKKMKKLVLFVAVIAAVSFGSCKQKAAPEPVEPAIEAVEEAAAVEEGVVDGEVEEAPAEEAPAAAE